MRGNQGQQVRSRNHQIHLIEEFTLARALGHKFESGGGKADLIHLNLTHEMLNWVTFADHPLCNVLAFQIDKQEENIALWS